MALDMLKPNEHPITYCMHESDWALCKQDICDLKTNLKSISQSLESLKLDDAVFKECITNMKITVDVINTKLTDMEVKIASHSGSNKWIERLLWAVVGCILSGSIAIMIKP